MAATSQDRVHLALAGLTYRGFYYWDWRILEDVHELEIRRTVADGLADDVIRRAIGDWTLVWGPATRRLGKDFDSSAMYVVERKGKRSELVVAVRGTNPIALSDWDEGDFKVAQQIEWPFAPPAEMAKVSFSTALGLSTLLRMASPDPSTLATVIEAPLATVSRFVPGALAKLARGVPTATADIARQLEKALAPARKAWEPIATQEAERSKRVLTALGSTQRHPPAIGWPPPQPPDRGAVTLVDFLRERARKEADPLDIVVTGHSKGGALAPTLALWLRETRAHWDSKDRARIGFHAFAGPTPGDGAFARRVAKELNGPCRRVVNSNDVVPHAWALADLAVLPKLYGGKLAWVAPITTAIQTQLKNHDYEHVPVATETFSGKLLGVADVAEMAHQHLDAYLEYVGLARQGVDTLKLFLG